MGKRLWLGLFAKYAFVGTALLDDFSGRCRWLLLLFSTVVDVRAP